jgi:hypothetical protein
LLKKYPFVISEPGLIGGNLLAASSEAADSSRDTAALRLWGIFKLHRYRMFVAVDLTDANH